MTHSNTPTAQQFYDDADLTRAVTAYKFFYPTVSGAAIIKGSQAVGLVPNKVLGILDCGPEQLVYTANSDTPYGPLLLDLSVGPLIVELQPGPLIVVSMDINQRWVADMGLPGPDAGNGGKHLLLGPDYTGPIPGAGYYVHRASSNRQIVGARSLPVGGDVAAAKQRLTTIKVYPLDPDAEWTEPQWLELTGKFQDTTPLQWENNLTFWQVLHETIDTEPAFPGYHTHYGELAALGIEKGAPFEPDDRMKGLLESAAQAGNAQMRVQAFADRTETARSGTTGSGSGSPCATRTETSTPPPMSTCPRGRNGSTRPSAPRPRCFAATPAPVRCTGWRCIRRQLAPKRFRGRYRRSMITETHWPRTPCPPSSTRSPWTSRWSKSRCPRRRALRSPRGA